jgi:predicted RNA-binding protein with PUA-like domain
MKKYWLFKTEPSTYSIEDLAREKTTEWWGIRNYQVRNMMRDDMQIGDEVLVYHSSTKEVGVVGTGHVTSAAYPDTKQFDVKNPYYDAKSKKENPTWLAVTLAFESKFSRTVLLEELRQEKPLKGMRLLQKGNRLSITQVTKEEFAHVAELAKK